MNTRPILACAIIASLLTIIPNALAAPAKKPFMLTGNIVYPNGKPAADATVILDIVNNSTHAVKTLTYKPDKNGHVSFAIDTTQFAVSMPVFYFTSPTGIGFWTFDHPMTVTTSTVQPYTKVKIHLVDGSGKPIAHVRICPAIFNMDRSVGWWSDAIPGDWTQTTDASGVAETKFTTDKAGHFMLKNVPRNKTGIWLKTPYGNYSSQDLTSGRGDNIIYLPKPVDPK